MKYFTIISSLLLLSLGKSFLFSKITSKRSIRFNSDSPSNYEDDFKYSTDYYQHLLKYDLIESSSSSSVLLSSGHDPSLTWSIKRFKNYQIFVDNLEKIQQFNQQSDGLKLDMNQFGDQYDFDSTCQESCHLDINNYISSQQEYIGFKRPPFLGLTKIFKNILKPLFFRSNPTPPSKNWKLFLPPVKNQLHCGSCWAFSTTNSIETLMNVHNYTYNRLSEQELVDFSIENDGCAGGLMHLAYDYIIQEQGLVSNEDYPYIIGSPNKDNVNISSFTRVNGSHIKNYEFIIPRSIQDIKESLQHGPIAIALDASSFLFRFYKEGVIDLPRNFSRDINHAVLLTGYEQDENGTHWIIQNSWGESWGEQGFARIRVRNGNGVLLCQLYGVYPQY